MRGKKDPNEFLFFLMMQQRQEGVAWGGKIEFEKTLPGKTKTYTTDETEPEQTESRKTKFSILISILGTQFSLFLGPFGGTRNLLTSIVTYT